LNASSAPTQGTTVGVIGVGRMGIRHLQAARQLGMEVVGLADISVDALDAACTSHSIDRNRGFTDAVAMLRQTRPVAVVVATTAPTHAELVHSAIETGVRYVLCEKPMASSLDQADALVTASAVRGVKLAVNHQMRFMPQYTQVKEMIGSEALGPLSGIVVAGSNFGLAMNASHYFEMFRYITGVPAQTVQAWLEDDLLPNPRGPQFRDRSGRLIVTAATGPTMFIDFSAHSGHGLQVVYICRNGQVTVDELSGDLRVSTRKSDFRTLPTSRYGMPADVSQRVIEPVDTVVPTMRVWSAMFTGENFPDGYAGRHAMACLVAAHVSNERGNCVVALDDPTLPTDRIFPWA
jgi:predicted dehydrogenase